MKQRLDWTDELVATLKRLWADGLTAAECGQVMGVSRGTITGKLDRLGLLGERSKQIKANAQAKSAARKAAALARAEARTTPAPRRPRVKDLPPVLIDVTKARPWITRGFGECAFPVGGEGADTLSCCLPTDDGATYCAGHYARMFSKDPPPSKGRHARSRFTFFFGRRTAA